MSHSTQGWDRNFHKLSRRQVIFATGAGLSAFLLSSLSSVPIFAQTAKPTQKLSAQNILAIQDLNTRHFYALDGLDSLIPGDPAINWANTFTRNGTFTITRATGEVLMKATGSEELVRTYKTFINIATTRHWIDDLVIEPDGKGAKSGCYIIAMNIQNNPATIVRTGVYQDRLVMIDHHWKFKSRTLILDPNSPVG
jgi:hypothetical protein